MKKSSDKYLYEDDFIMIDNNGIQWVKLEKGCGAVVFHKNELGKDTFPFTWFYNPATNENLMSVLIKPATPLAITLMIKELVDGSVDSALMRMALWEKVKSSLELQRKIDLGQVGDT